MKILHVLDHYKPRSDGYVYRSQYILANQRALGLDVAVVTSPKHGSAQEPFEQIDSIPIYRSSDQGYSSAPFIREVQQILHLKKRISEIIKKENPQIVHAHSPSLNGIAALLSARKASLPVVYEVRALWEDAAVEQGKWGERSLRYIISRQVETRLLRRVDAVFTICNGIMQEIARRGVPPDRITLIRNCVDSRLFCPQSYDTALAEKLGLQGKRVLGFIGSFFDFEGLDLLIDAYKRLLQSNPDIRLLLVGDGIEKKNLMTRAHESGLDNFVVFTGSVPHSEVLRYYSIIDVLAYPRKSLRITEMVTPLKPLEAMSMGKLVVGSDVGGVKELISDGTTGFLFRAGDLNDLTAKLIEIFGKSEALGAVRETAMKHIREKHNWSKTVSQYLPIYQRLIHSL